MKSIFIPLIKIIELLLIGSIIIYKRILFHINYLKYNMFIKTFEFIINIIIIL